MPKAAKKTKTQSKTQNLIAQIEKMRGSKVICFLTTLRPGVQGPIADDQVRVIFDHLLNMGDEKVERLDLFLVSNGGTESYRGALFHSSESSLRNSAYSSHIALTVQPH